MASLVPRFTSWPRSCLVMVVRVISRYSLLRAPRASTRWHAPGIQANEHAASLEFEIAGTLWLGELIFRLLFLNVAR